MLLLLVWPVISLLLSISMFIVGCADGKNQLRGSGESKTLSTMKNVSNTMSREGAKSKQLSQQSRVGEPPSNIITGVAINQTGAKSQRPQQSIFDNMGDDGGYENLNSMTSQELDAAAK
ncbi:hypothetical protein WR25_04988 [Diploscapter pachys]|uniref:Uncharacterized protein n=1 Tax=Diploscapter pachys TaxID=2018661 RepID=A0A2A2J529_9BILA|nr:hypothetical protein WR25_04988 [Diploscapter pachys]